MRRAVRYIVKIATGHIIPHIGYFFLFFCFDHFYFPAQLVGFTLSDLLNKPWSHVIRLSLGRRLVNLFTSSPTDECLNKWRRRQAMGRWSWVRISRPPWKRFLKKSDFPHVKNLKSHSPWVPRYCKELRSKHVRPHTKTKNPAVQRGGECYKA